VGGVVEPPEGAVYGYPSQLSENACRLVNNGEVVIRGLGFAGHDGLNAALIRIVEKAVIMRGCRSRNRREYQVRHESTHRESAPPSSADATFYPVVAC
jgi:hypothetical protein